jgi:TonB-dependent SusC/RagA subfamily outer membrane receptor
MRNKLLLFMLVSIQAFGQSESAESILNKYFNSDRQQISIRKDTLWVIWHEPADKINPQEFRDTSAIPLNQISQVKFIKGRNPQGEPGIGMQLIPWVSVEKVKSKSLNEVDNQTLNQVNVATVNQKLQGQVSGVTIGNDNSPGGSAMVRIRGIGSINANSPLYVVDGVPISGNINSINPADIAAVNVLKDPSQTAMYGVRGANGVIVISTIKGGTTATGIPEEFQRGVTLPLTLWTWGKQSKDFKKSGSDKNLKKILSE